MEYLYRRAYQAGLTLEDEEVDLEDSAEFECHICGDDYRDCDCQETCDYCGYTTEGCTCDED